MKSEQELDAADWQLIHTYRNERHHQRRGRLTATRRARLEAWMPWAEQEAARRGIPDAILKTWRAYPVDGNLGELDLDGRTVTVTLPHGRARKSDKPAAMTASEAMDKCERALADAMCNGNGNGRAPAANGDLEAQLKASLRQRGIEP